MGRRVKCKITGEYGDSNNFYKVGRDYYKSKNVYEIEQERKKTKGEALKIIAALLGYGEGQRLPPLVFKKYNELNFYADQVILETLRQIRESVEYCVAKKDFKDEWGKVQYIFTAVQNHIVDIDRTYKRKEKERLMAEKQIKFSSGLIESLNSNIKAPPQITRNTIGDFIKEGDDEN